MTISHIPTITYPTILTAVFANQLCLPIPSVLFLITAGALVQSGRLNLATVILAGVVGSLLADYAWFMAGRWGDTESCAVSVPLAWTGSVVPRGLGGSSRDGGSLA
jgi:membrane protein DedA with SNARE-associated domain